MEYEEAGSLDGVPIRVPTGDGYRMCSVCGADCEPDPTFGSDEHGARIVFVCPEHGVESLVDPFAYPCGRRWLLRSVFVESRRLTGLGRFTSRR